MDKKTNNKRGPRKGTQLNDIPRSEIGARIFTARRLRGISQKELGEKVGVTLRAISYYERETENIPAETVKRIAEALGVSTAYLLGESSSKLPASEKPFALKRVIDKLEALPKKDQKTIIDMIDALTTRSMLNNQ